MGGPTAGLDAMGKR